MPIALLLLPLALASPPRADLGPAVEAFARNAMRVVGTPPGLAVVVVADGRVVVRRELGLRDVEAKLPVTGDTRFYIASSTKAFTGMAALVLAEDGRLDLDAPVTTYWPELKLTPPLDAKRLSIRDFLAMRPGLSNDTYNYRSALVGNLSDEKERLRVLATYSKERPRTFQYSNASYEIAAQLVEKAAGKRWQDVVAEKVLAPLGMTSTMTEVPAGAVPAASFYESTGPGAFRRTQGKTNATMGPAGGMFTTSGDAARWILAMLQDGRLDGRQALPRRAVRAAQSPQTTQNTTFHYFHRWAWGIGQDLGDYGGEILVHRFGGYNGAFSHISWMPDRGFGVAVFSNGGSGVADAVAAYAYDVLLGTPDLEAKWEPELRRLAAAVEKQRDDARKAVVVRQEPGRALERYAGSYDSDRLGRVEVRVDGATLRAAHGVLRAELVPVGGDDFRVDWADEGAPDPLRFTFDAEGRATGFDWGGRVFERAR